MKVQNTGEVNSSVDFEYHANGQLASRNASGKAENFFWDGLALVKRNATNYTVEPAVTGGNPVLADDEALFNDMLGTTLGAYNGKEFIDNHRTAFGAGSNKGFFTGKPYVEDLGAVFLFRSYRPDTGKLMTSDPLSYPDGWNNFAYCNNHINIAFDPLGLEYILDVNVGYGQKSGISIGEYSDILIISTFGYSLNASKTIASITPSGLIDTGSSHGYALPTFDVSLNEDTGIITIPQLQTSGTGGSVGGNIDIIWQLSISGSGTSSASINLKLGLSNGDVSVWGSWSTISLKAKYEE